MQIECPFCHATSSLSSSQEGAKVRCSGCKKVYVARDRSQKRSASGPGGLQIGIAVGAVALMAVVVLLVRNSKKPATAPAQVSAAGPSEESAAPVVDSAGWDSEPVRAVRNVYDTARAFNEIKLSTLLDGERIALRLSSDERPLSWTAMSTVERESFLREVVSGLMTGDGPLVAALWKPYDGKVTSEERGLASVEVLVSGRDDAAANQTHTLVWSLARSGTTWKAFDWQVATSPEAAPKAAKKVSVVQTESGARLFQAEPRDLPHLDDTPADQRKHIDELVVRMNDFTLKPRENAAASDELIALGRPAIPALLTAMHRTPIVDDETLAKVGRLHHTLRDLTGYDPGFPVTVFGPEAEAEREIAIKAWFAWWFRKGEKNFQGRVEGPDGLDESPAPPAKGNR